MDTSGNPEEPVMDFDEESTLEQESTFDPLDEADNTMDRNASIYDTSWVPDDRPPKRSRHGETLTEMREGETLDQRLAEDEPDLLEQELGDPVDQILGPRVDTEDDPNVEENRDAQLATEADDDPEVAELLAAEGGDTDIPAASFEEEDPRAGRIVEPDEGAHGDVEKDLVARDAGISGGAASAEEAAMHVVDDLPGAIDR